MLNGDKIPTCAVRHVTGVCEL